LNSNKNKKKPKFSDFGFFHCRKIIYRKKENFYEIH